MKPADSSNKEAEKFRDFKDRVLHGIKRSSYLTSMMEKVKLDVHLSESDSQTLGLQLSVLGHTWGRAFKNEWVDYIREVPKIYIHQEPGEGGETFLKQICGKLLDEGYRGKAYVIHTPGAKDPSDLHIQNPDKFKEIWQLTLDNAKELDLADFEPKPEEIIPDAPVRIRTPLGWLVNEKGVHQETKDGLVTICATPLLISRRLKASIRQ